MADSSDLSQNKTFLLDLAKRRGGYLAPSSDVIHQLRLQGLVTTQDIGDGFLIVRAIVPPSKRLDASRRFVWPRDVRVTA